MVYERGVRGAKNAFGKLFSGILEQLPARGTLITDRSVAVGRYARVPKSWDESEISCVFLPKSPSAAFF